MGPRKSITKEVVFEPSVERSEFANHAQLWEEGFQTARTAHTKALGWEELY